mmetsp:Transcript_12895/g.19531  ORF Transcript_12895/g.19531 Transcript_12895/m.19531 type:complete len:615 (+) Transcript_12895:153-1997(+)
MHGIITKSPSVSSSVSYRIEDGLVIAQESGNDQDLSVASLSINTAEGSASTPSSKETKAPSCIVQGSTGDGVGGTTGVELNIMGPTPADIITPTETTTNNPRLTKQLAGPSSVCTDSLYGHPLSVPKLKEHFNMIKDHKKTTNGVNDSASGENGDDYISWEDGGLVWYSTIVPSDFDTKVKSGGGLSTLKMLPQRFYDEKNKCIKPRRPNLAVCQTDFFSSLVKIDLGMDTKNSSTHSGDGNDDDREYFAGLNDEDFEVFDHDHNINMFGGTITGEPELKKIQRSRWIFSGVLNGWPGLKHLELVQIEYKSTMVPTWRTHWRTDNNPKDLEPTYPKSSTGLTEVRAKLREPEWSAIGWTKDSPGYVLWYSGPATTKVPRVLHGTNIIKQFEKERFEKGNRFGRNNRIEPSPKCSKVHIISHRYAVKSERWKDKLTYHSFALLEWDHGEHCTVVELAFLNGLGGYSARCNHLEDRDEPINSMIKCFPPEMVKPWKDTLSELRCIDVRAKNLREYLGFMKLHTGKDKRFIDVRHTFSHAVRLTFCTKEQIAQYLINYIRRGRTYSEMRKNCQTFAADFCAFLAGKKDVQPFHPLNRFEYRNQTHYFMYESTMYEHH